MLALTAGACSSDVTRFSEPFFSSEVTGSVAPVPAESVGGGGYASNAATGGYGGGYASSAAGSSYGSSYTSQPLPLPAYAAQGGQSYASNPVQPVSVPSYGASAAVQSPHAAGGQKVVAPGDTVYSIARAYNVSESELMRANGMSSPSDLRIGQRLVIPGAGMSATVASAPRASASAIAPATPPRTATSGGYVVKPGDTLYTIARAHDVRVADIASANGLQGGGQIRVGQELVIPGAGHQPVRVAAVQDPKIVSDVKPQPFQADPAPVRSVATMPVEASPPASTATQPVAAIQQPAVKEAEPVRQAALTEPEARSASEFRWPVRGRVISSFGEKASGRSNDGINISVPVGTSIRAAENGVVAYAGNELEGYGNLVLIRHSDNWVTAYAHADKLLVKKGETVKRGQVIAQAGQTGSVDTPQVHFELRQGSRPVDPLKYLSSL